MEGRVLKGFRQRHRLLVLAGCAFSIWSGAAFAQDKAPPTQPDTAAPQVDGTASPAVDGSLEGDIVVTAQRRSERLVDIPMSVAVVTSKDLEKSGVVSMHDLANAVSGVQINFAGCCTQPAVRGISTLTTGIGYENNVAVYVDGFYAPDNVAINSDLANISTVEVLKGPQGTLYGRNATGGAILINTLAPSDTFTGTFKASYARFNDYSLSGYVSGPISDRVRVGVASYLHQSDGYNRLLDANGNFLSNRGSPLKQGSIRAKLEADLTDNLTATVGYNFGLSSDSRGDLFKYIAYTSAAIPASPPRASKPFDVSYNRLTTLRATVDEGTLKLALKTGIGTLTSYTGFAHRFTFQSYDLDGSYRDVSGAANYWPQNTFQQALDFNVTAIKGLDLVVGGTYYNDDLNSTNNKNFANFVPSSQLNTRLRTSSWAAYVDGTYHLTKSLALSLGGRYTIEKKTGTFSSFTGPGVLQYSLANDVTFRAFTPRAAIRFELAPRTNIYAAVARGFRSGGFPASGATSQALYLPYKPENITSYEVGFKTSSSILQFNAAVFYYDYRDLQVGLLVPNPNGNGSIITLVANAKRAEVYGFDADLNFKPVDNLDIRFGVAYLHARYKDFHNSVGTGLNTTTNLNVSNQPQDWTNQQMTRAPTLSGILNIDYTVKDIAGGSVSLGANGRYTDSYVINNASLFGPLAGAALANKQRFRQDAYTVLNLHATWTDSSSRYSIGVFGNNVTNTIYKITNNGTAFGEYASYGAPATYGIRVGYNF
jgi:iron complex outermembrane receptor protein